MKKLKNIYLWPMALVYFIYRICREKTFYVVGTGISKDTGRRMWFKTTFITYGNLLPIKSLELKAANELGFNGCVITFFHRIPNSMREYVNNHYDLELIRTEAENE